MRSGRIWTVCFPHTYAGPPPFSQITLFDELGERGDSLMQWLTWEFGWGVATIADLESKVEEYTKKVARDSEHKAE